MNKPYINDNLYDMFFKRKSFHLFRNIGAERLSDDDISGIQEAWKSLVPLYPDIRTAIRIVPRGETTCKQGGEYCVLFYSEKKDNYLQNIGYLGEQLDLWLVAQNIGTLWCGLAMPDAEQYDGLDFVIMMVIAKVDDESKFRKDMFKAKRKSAAEMWLGEPIEGVTDIVRFAPSACNSQPWLVKNDNGTLSVSRYKKPGKIGIFSQAKLGYYNQIDIGIFLCILELCLQHIGMSCNRQLFTDTGSDAEKTLIAEYGANR